MKLLNMLLSSKDISCWSSDDGSLGLVFVLESALSDSSSMLTVNP